MLASRCIFQSPHCGRYTRVCRGTVISVVRRRLAGLSILLALGAMALLAVPVSAAQADVIDLSACNLAPLSQPFAPWLDPSSYELAPGGDFESDGWSLSGGAQRVPGSEPFAATGTLGSWSLAASGRRVCAVTADVRRCRLSDDPLLHAGNGPAGSQRGLRERDPAGGCRSRRRWVGSVVCRC